MKPNTTEPTHKIYWLRIVLALSLLMVGSLIGLNVLKLPVSEAQLGDWDQGISQDGVFSIRHPSKWRFLSWSKPNQGKRGESDEIASILTVQNNPYITIAQAPDHVQMINDLQVWAEQRLNQRAHYEELALNGLIESIPGYPIREYQFSTKIWFSETTYHCYDWYPIHDEVGYQFTFCSFDKDWDVNSPIFEQMIASVQFDP